MFLLEILNYPDKTSFCYTFFRHQEMNSAFISDNKKTLKGDFKNVFSSLISLFFSFKMA